MKANDIAVNLDTLASGSHKLGKKVSELEQLASQLWRNLSVAGREFDSENFKRTEAAVREIMQKLHNAMDRLQEGCAFLNGLEEKAEVYLGCRYRG